MPGLEELWEETVGDPRICVAVLDGPVDRSHPSLRDALLTDVGLVNPGRGIASRHGTHIASIIFGQHDGPVLGIAPRCRGLVVPIFWDDHGDRPACSPEQLSAAIRTAVGAGAHVINISASGMNSAHRQDPSLEEAIRLCASAGVLVVASAGNQGHADLQIPGALPPVLAVGAMDVRGEPLESSNWTVPCESCGLLAPGEAILGALPGGGTGLQGGTSCAAAIVSGVAALLLSLQLKWGRDLDASRVREVLLESASWKEGDSARTLAGRLDIRAAALLLKASPGTPGAACAPPGSRQGDWTAAGSTTCAYVVAPQRLADRYAGVSHHKFGTIDIKLPDGRAYNVPHLHYAIGDGQLGMRFLPVSDEAGVGRPDGASAPSSSLIDAFLRRETGLNPEDPIYALLSYIHPEEHTVDFSGLTSGYLLQLGHRHIGAYLGNGLTSHVLPRKTEWKGDGPLKMKWNVDLAPATVHVLSLHGVSQSVLNRNAHIVNGILAAYGRAPTNPKTLTCRTIDINTTLQFYRDTIRGADYLEDLSWFTNCAVHTTIVVNTLVNVPHNESSFRLIFGDEGFQLWSEFRRRFEEVQGRAFLPEDETHFVPLWRLVGLTPEQIRPLSFLEYNRFQVAKLEGWLDEYPGRVPLAPGKGLAWPLESVVDLVSRFLEVYTNLRDAGGVNAAAALLCLRHGAESILGLSSDTYVEFVKPFVTALILAEAISEGGGDPAWLDAAGRQLEAIAVETDETPNPYRGPAASVVRAIRECVEDAVHWVANTSGQVDQLPPDAAAWFRDVIEPARDRLNALALSGRSVAGLFSTPSIIHQIERGLHPHSPFIKIRALCTAMDRSELVPNCSRHFTQGQLLAVRVPDLAGDTRDHGHLERQQRKDTRGMADAKVAVSLDAPARGAAVRSPQPGAPSIVPSSDAVTPAACECGSRRSDDPSRLAYVFGQVGYDFVSQSRLNSIRQRMGGPAGPEMGGSAGPEEPKSLLKHFESSPYEASACQWLLMLDETPIYAIEPSGPFARETYDLLRQFLREQIEEGVERVSVPGVVAGTARLRSGITVPVLVPEARGMFSWTTEALVKSLTGAEPGKPEGEETSRGVRNFLDRVYHQIRNMGRTPQERAINFVATYVFEVGKVFEQAIREEMELDTIEVTPSPIARPDSDCWDVSLTFFYPQRPVQTVRKVHRFTVDVLDVIPSVVSPPRSWFIR